MNKTNDNSAEIKLSDDNQLESMTPRERLKYRRNKLRLTRNKLAEKAGCTAQYIYLLEKGDKPIDNTKKINAILEILKIDMDYLLSGSTKLEQISEAGKLLYHESQNRATALRAYLNEIMGLELTMIKYHYSENEAIIDEYCLTTLPKKGKKRKNYFLTAEQYEMLKKQIKLYANLLIESLEDCSIPSELRKRIKDNPDLEEEYNNLSDESYITDYGFKKYESGLSDYQ